MSKRALILGKGASGRAAAKKLVAEGYEVDYAEDYSLVIASPGVPVKSELQYGVEHLRAKGTRLIAVTGSKGKSSVVKLIAEALNLTGVKAVPCGNYGLPVSEVYACDWAVVEVSSYQLETTNLPPDTFEAAVILNLQDDHLARHGSREVYHGLKRGLLTMAKAGFEAWKLEADDAIAGSYFDNPILRANAAGAVAVLRQVGVSPEVIRQAFRQFQPLPHRMSLVGTVKGMACIDDSKATSLAALAAALQMTGSSVRLIAGGRAKGDDPKSIKEHLTKHAKKVYLIGECLKDFYAAWADVVPCEECGTLEHAVQRAFEEAEEGDKLLLSPGTASFDQFNSFEERGNVFTQLIYKEKGKRNEEVRFDNRCGGDCRFGGL